ncbi:hypothetical protein [Streptacidiphilus sp. EB129]|uniref:hypothetical protein n=1 Tax=Streptacidiphilus sp. EB129 TaxID=3156262 RepID=UPI003511E9B7
MSARTLPVRVALAGSGWAAVLCAGYLADAAPLRIAVVLAFVPFCPGYALLGPLLPREPTGDRSGPAQTLLLTVLLSLSLLVVAATGLMLPGWFTGLRTLAVLAVTTTVAALLPVRR